MTTSVKERLLSLIEHLNHGLVEREAAIKAALLAMLAGENMLLVGPPGTAKSLIARKLAKCLDEEADSHAGKEYFEYLLTKFTTPEEIFGPLSISELKQDRFKRNTTGYLPSVRVAFLDEIFKASSSILNALLTILNERTYHNGAEALDVPLQALIAASNELPTGQEELEALYDRFLVRSFVDYVRAENLPRLLEKTAPPRTLPKLTTNNIEAIRQAAEEVQLTDDVIAALQRIWGEHKRVFKEDRRENLSDRRLKKAVHLLRTSAASNGRREVDLSDILLLKDCLWNHPDNALKVRQLVMDTLRSFSRVVPHNGEPSTPSEDMPPTSLIPATGSAGKLGAVIKGFKGSGTEHDPILIETLHDLAGLERPEVGQQGYYFRQTGDIDCSPLDTWLDIIFKGHYEGGGHAVSYNDAGKYLFKEAKESFLTNLRLTGLGLAAKAIDCQVTACETTATLLGHPENSQIVACSADERMVNGLAKNCSITQCQSGESIADLLTDCIVSQCQSGDVLIRKHATSSTIQNCSAQIKAVRDRGAFGGIAVKLSTASTVECCFVTGTFRSDSMLNTIDFTGIADACEESTIRQCALGAFKCEKGVTLSGRITKSTTGSTLQDNVALDCHKGQSASDGKDGKSLSSALFTAHYLEHTLGWDFDTVWQWNDKLNQPELQSVGSKAQFIVTRHAASAGEQGDLLNQQLLANIWL